MELPAPPLASSSSVCIDWRRKSHRKYAIICNWSSQTGPDNSAPGRVCDVEEPRVFNVRIQRASGAIEPPVEGVVDDGHHHTASLSCTSQEEQKPSLNIASSCPVVPCQRPTRLSPVRGNIPAQNSGAWNHDECLPEYPPACTLDARRAPKN